MSATNQTSIPRLSCLQSSLLRQRCNGYNESMVSTVYIYIYIYVCVCVCVCVCVYNLTSCYEN